jgi:hypothetical protein
MYEDILRARLWSESQRPIGPHEPSGPIRSDGHGFNGHGFNGQTKLSRGLYGFFYEQNEFTSFETRYLKGPTSFARFVIYAAFLIIVLAALVFFVLPLACIALLTNTLFVFATKLFI